MLAALFGDGGLAIGGKPGTIIVDQTTGDPVATRAVATESTGSGIELLDAPVSGGKRGAETGTIAIMVGTGHAMKLVNNMLSGVQRLLSFEGMA